MTPYVDSRDGRSLSIYGSQCQIWKTFTTVLLPFYGNRSKWGYLQNEANAHEIATCKHNVGQKEDFMHSNFQMDISLPWIDAGLPKYSYLSPKIHKSKTVKYHFSININTNQFIKRNSRDTGIWSKGQNNENKNQYKNNDLRYRSTLELSKTHIHIGSYIKEILVQKYWQLKSTK